MVRSYWIGPVLMVLAVTGLAWCQVLPPGSTPASPKEHTMTVQETDKPPLKCKVLRMWHEPDGTRAFLVQAIASGETITIVQTGAAQGKTAATKIYHWGDDARPPAGAPVAPADAIVLGTPVSSVEFPKTPYPPKTPGDLPKVTTAGQKWPAAFASEIVDAKPVASGPPTVVARRLTEEAKPSDPDKVWPAAFAPEGSADKSVTMPIQKSGLDLKKDGPVIDATPPGMPVQIKGVETQKTVAAQPAMVNPAPVGASPAVSTAPKPLVTDVVRSGEDKATTPGGVTHVPLVNSAAPKLVVQAPSNATPVVVPNTTAAAPKMTDAGAPAKIPDWHQSWGRAESPPPDAFKKPEPPRPVEARLVPKADAKKADAKQSDLPHAEPRKVDPLMQPDRYTKAPVPGNDAKPVQQVKNTTVAEGSAAKPHVTPQPEVLKADKGTPAVPLGMGSVAAALAGEPEVVPPASTAKGVAPARPYYGGNAFTPSPVLPADRNPAMPAPAQPQLLPAAANAAMPAQAPAGNAQYAQGNSLPPMMPPPYQPLAVQIPMDRGVPSGMTNAFTSGGTTRPIPSDFGQPSQGGNAFTAANQADPQVALRHIPATPYNGSNTLVATVERRPAPVQVQQMQVATAEVTNAPQLLAVLRDSLYPSQREWAADSLAAQRGSHSQPQVVAGLLSAAKEDPAPTVRAGCVRAIAQLKINTLPAVAVVQSLKNDPDARVRREVEQALPVLTAVQPLAPDTSVRPVSGH
jgi:hypothetical protein